MSMKHTLHCILLAALLTLTGCGTAEAGTQHYYIQEVAHLYPYAVLSAQDTSETYTPCNYEEVRAVWIPIMQYADWMTGKSAAQFRTAVREACKSCCSLGINTLYVHMRSYCDAYYASALFPKGAYLDGDYDPLAILLEEAHACALSVHAWVNPMRAATSEVLAAADKRYPVAAWYADAEKNGTYLVQSGAQYYLNPAYEEVRSLIADGVTEIVANYDVDGIHIDDYFYPTQDAAFDAQAFTESGCSDLAAWRRENCNAMVKAMYDAVKAQDERLLFGISPQGNMQTNYHKLYADTALWCSAAGYCDYIAPQIYYGFENETCPFEETAKHWEQIATEVSLIIGLAPYKIGLEDTWAGTGSTEWQNDPTVLSKQAALVKELDGAEGVALYSYASVFTPQADAAAMVTAERERIGVMWR